MLISENVHNVLESKKEGLLNSLENAVSISININAYICTGDTAMRM